MENTAVAVKCTKLEIKRFPLNSPKFEIEKLEITRNGLSLSLLYFKVTISKEGKSSFEFYKKTSKKTTIGTPSISHSQKIKDKLHSQ